MKPVCDQIRPLGPGDAEMFQRVRLQSLRDSPEAFGSTYDEDAMLSLAVVSGRLEHIQAAPARVVFGAWSGAALIGFVGAMQQSKRKVLHSAVVWGMYVVPDARGVRVGVQLMEHLIAEVRQWPGVERLTLSVVERAVAARRLYEAVGFTEFGIETDAFREGDVRDTAVHMVLGL